MLVKALFIFIHFFILKIHGQTICPAGTVEKGPCVNNGLCPTPGDLCISNSCCGIIGGTSTTFNPLGGNCVDKTNPKTGVSDCPLLAKLCADSTYYTLMTEQCPLTCNRCGVSASNGIFGTTTYGIGGGVTGIGGNCVDKTKPNGGSDCAQVANLCNNPTYYAVMTEQCPLTCGRCGAGSNIGGFGTTIPGGSTGCSDMRGPNGTSDCPQRVFLCNNPLYYELMTQQCPSTCGRCNGAIGGFTTTPFGGGLLTTTTPAVAVSGPLIMNEQLIIQYLINKQFDALVNQVYHPLGTLIFDNQFAAFGTPGTPGIQNLLTWFQTNFGNRDIVSGICLASEMVGVSDFAIEKATCQLTNADNSSSRIQVQWIYQKYPANGEYRLLYDITQQL